MKRITPAMKRRFVQKRMKLAYYVDRKLREMGFGDANVHLRY
jgi:hypothetical protein